MNKNFFDYKKLKNWVSDIFKAEGLSSKDASVAAANLLEADLKGFESHGLLRLKVYLDLIQRGTAKKSPKVKIIKRTRNTALFDADKSLGLVVAELAMKKAINLCKNNNIGFVGVKNSNHYGIAGQYAEMAVEHNMIGVSLTNGPPAVVPTRGKEKIFGTNPMAFAIPVNKSFPFLMDFATSTVSWGKMQSSVFKKKIPLGWALDERGLPSRSLRMLANQGGLTPLGGDEEHSSYKGYALCALVDILCGVLTGAEFGPLVPKFVSFKGEKRRAGKNGIGHFFGAIKIDSFMPIKAFEKRMKRWIKIVKSSKLAPGEKEILVPGEKEYFTKKERIKCGIPIDKSLLSELKNIGKEKDILFPEEL